MIRVESLSPEMMTEASRVLAQCFATNPLHISAFGKVDVIRNEAFFGTGLELMKGPKFVAVDGTQIVGLIHWVRSPSCQFAGMERIRMVPVMIQELGVNSAIRVGRWLSAWSRHDPGEPHLHLGPIGVSPDMQGRRIGHQLMELYCKELEQTHLSGYLETDRPENVTFYRRFGFETVGEIQVLGVPNFLMSRKSGR